MGALRQMYRSTLNISSVKDALDQRTYHHSDDVLNHKYSVAGKPTELTY